ncbi:uncharacterized protein LOC133625402 [Colius striatus]|uniref:uncharacterized protein LOC133625402 n=1 Tax=Colius striatus TaxID=57412 RepID=UPI002B1E3C3B|nr:uncharacterized protein LOC133625402 [Colius striatus]
MRAKFLCWSRGLAVMQLILHFLMFGNMMLLTLTLGCALTLIALLSWLYNFVKRMKGPGNMMAQIIIASLILLLMNLVCCGSYLVEAMGQSTSFSSARTDLDNSVTQTSQVLSHPYTRVLILLINMVGILYILWNLESSGYQRVQICDGNMLKCPLKRPVPGWQGMWMNLGKFLGRLSPPVIWDFTSEQIKNPALLTRYLIEGCLTYPNEAHQVQALYWGLASAYRAAFQSSQRTVIEMETQTVPETNIVESVAVQPSQRTMTEVEIQTIPETNIVESVAVQPSQRTMAEVEIQTIPETTMVESGNQTTTTVVAPVVKKKQWIRRSSPYHRLVRADEEEEERLEEETGPSVRRSGEVREIEKEMETTRSLTSTELRDMRKDYSRQPGERIGAWLLRCWDNGADSQQLEGREAQQLGSLARDRGIDKGIGKKTSVCSLWKRLLSSVRARYPFKEDLVNARGKWTRADEGIQYLRELAVLEVIYGDLDNVEASTDPDDVQCTRAMLRKVIQSAPATYSNILAMVYHPDMDIPTVERVSSWLQNYEESLCTSSSVWDDGLIVRSASRIQSSTVPTRGKGSPRRRSTPRNELWLFLRGQGEDMRKWDGEPTFKLEARVRELRGKAAVRKGPPKRAVSRVAAKTKEDNQQSPRHRRTATTSFEANEETSGLQLQGSDSEYSDEEQK